MKLFKQVLQLVEGNDLSELPEQTMSDIQSNIRKGAQDTEQKWANALELTHKAYEVTGVQRPNPNMQAAWKQYEENIAYAVEQLSKARGIKADWRMSSSSLHEAAGLIKFKVHLELPNMDTMEAITEAPDIETIIDVVKQRIEDDPELGPYDTRLEDKDKGVKLSFWLHGVRSNSFITITPTK